MRVPGARISKQRRTQRPPRSSCATTPTATFPGPGPGTPPAPHVRPPPAQCACTASSPVARLAVSSPYTDLPRTYPHLHCYPFVAHRKLRLFSAILIRTAAIAYGRLPDFPVQARDEPELSERVAWSLRHPVKRLEESIREESFEVERAAQMWEKWEGGRWNPRRFRHRAGSRL